MTDTRIQKLEELVEAAGPIIASSALRTARFCGKDVAWLVQTGKLYRVRRGYYARSLLIGSLNEYEILSTLIPEGIISLFSAAQYHNLTTVIPQCIEITIPAAMRTPVMPDNFQVKVHKAADPFYQAGIETVQTANSSIKIYDRERTVCDFIRRRLKTGKDVALEVLRNYMSGRKNLQRIYEYAKLLQIEGVIHPYLEVLV